MAVTRQISLNLLERMGDAELALPQEFLSTGGFLERRAGSEGGWAGGCSAQQDWAGSQVTQGMERKRHSQH